jgi:phosphoribosylamine--glycine ligase
LIEEFLEGEEMSFFIISDGKNFKKFGTAQDHKRIFEGDKGKNTGGMGAYSPSRLESDELNKKIIEKIIDPTLKGLKYYKTNFTGFLYAGLMVIKNEPYLIEYNVRMGDPECQTIIPKVKTDLAEIFEACVNKKLNEIDIEWYEEKSICIVLYPFDDNTIHMLFSSYHSISISFNFLFTHASKISAKSVFTLGIIVWHSGSPILTLYSIR